MQLLFKTHFEFLVVILGFDKQFFENLLKMSAPYVKDVSQYLTTKQRESSKDIGAEWARVEDLYNKK